MSRLEEIRQRAEAGLTPGPWKTSEHCNCLWRETEDLRDYEDVIDPAGNFCNHADAAFIAASREDIPYLLELVDRMRECLRDYSLSDDVAQLDGNCGIGGECQENANRLLAEIESKEEA